MDTLTAAQQLGINQRLTSPNGRYALVMQGDGNLVLYEGGTAHWATGTWNLPAFSRPDRTVMQDDGNLVLYSAMGLPAWASGTNGKGGNRLVLQDDRNVVIYRPDGVAVWDTGTWVRQPTPSTAAPLGRQQRNEVGWGKFLDSSATLYRDGTLMVSTKTENNSWTDGLWGRVLVVAADAQGRAVWVSPVFSCTTRCSVPDVSCASFGTDVFRDKFPDVVGTLATHVDVYQSNRGNFVDLRAAFVAAIKAASDIVAALGPLIALL